VQAPVLLGKRGDPIHLLACGNTETVMGHIAFRLVPDYTAAE
jgi:hypothetical protein